MYGVVTIFYCALVAVLELTAESVLHQMKLPTAMAAQHQPLYKCPCEPGEIAACQRHKKSDDSPQKPEVVIITDGSTKFHHWNWDSISTVIAQEDAKHNAYPELMCYTKMKGKKYGIMETSWEYAKIEQAHLGTQFPSNITEADNEGYAHFDDFVKWLNKIQNHTESLFADVVVLNLIPTLSGSDLDTRNCTVFDIFLKYMQSKVKMSSISYTIEFHCVVPDRPVYFGSKCDVTQRMMKFCDKIVINPDSFQTDSQMKCRAKAGVPLTRLLGAVDEYMSHDVDRSKIIVGISWHGFQYKCKEFEEQTQICILPNKPGTEDCDFTAKKTPLRELVKQWHGENPQGYNWSQFYQAPYLSIWNSTDNSSQQLWYENMESLIAKYSLVRELKLSGVSIWTAEDLPSVNVPFLNNYDSNMWAWLQHTILQSNSGPKKTPSSIAGSMAAVGVVCVLIGAFLGFAFACAIN